MYLNVLYKYYLHFSSPKSYQPNLIWRKQLNHLEALKN